MFVDELLAGICRDLIEIISLAQVKHPQGINLQVVYSVRSHMDTLKVILVLTPSDGFQGKLSVSDDNVTASSLLVSLF